MSLTIDQQIEILQDELKNLEFGKEHYSKNRLYSNDLKHAIQMREYDQAIIAKQKQISVLRSSKSESHE